MVNGSHTSNMGIPSLFKKLTSQHPDLLTNTIPPRRAHVDTLYIDFNCLIHNASRNVSVDDSTLVEFESVLEHVNDETVIANTIGVLQTMIQKVGPKHVFIATDGPVPKAKMMKQRERRLGSVGNESVGLSFDSNAITPGTAFMEKLAERIRSCIYFQSFGCDSVIFSDYRSPGEGEQKIFDRLRASTPNDSNTHVIYGMDADLIVLSMASEHYRSIVLCRESTETNDMQYMSMAQCLDLLRVSHDRRRDFVLALMLGGNDFVPSIEFLKIRNGGWEIIHSQFVSFPHRLIGSSDTICWDYFHQFLSSLVKLEKSTLRDQQNQRQHRSHKPSEDIYHHGFFSDPKHPLHEQYGAQSLRSVVDRSEYYEHIFGNADEAFIQNASQYFIAAVRWCWDYYIRGTILSWDFYYPYIAGPRLEDVCLYLRDNNVRTETPWFETPLAQHVFTPLEQLLCVLPKRSVHLFPESVRIATEDDTINPIETSFWSTHDTGVWIEPITGQKTIYSNSFLPDVQLEHAVLLADVCSDTLTGSEMRRSTLEVKT
jgi:5'-3' exonuclease